MMISRAEGTSGSEEVDRAEEDPPRKDGESGLTVETEVLSLRRTVTLLGAISFNVGTMIGSGIFITPTSVLRNTGSVGLDLIVWSLGGVLSLLGSLTVSELACRVPKHGGLYAYIREGFGSWLAFLLAYKEVLFDNPSGLAVKSLTFSRYFVKTFDLCGTPQTLVSLVAVTLIVTLCVLNITSNRASVLVNIAFLCAKVLALLIIICGGLYWLATGKVGTSDLSKSFEGTVQNPASIAISFYFVMFSYSGWDGANNIVEEVKNPKRNVPLASLLSVAIVTCIYVLTNVSYLAVMSRQEMLSSDTVAMTWGEKVLGGGIASLIIPICVMISTSGSSNSGIFSGPRQIFSAARDGNLPEVLSYVHVTRYTPIPATFLVVSIAILFVCQSDIVTLIRFVGLANWFFYFLCAASLIIIRFRQRGKDEDIPFKQPLLVPVLFLLLSLYLTVMPQVGGVTKDLLYMCVVFALGLVLYVLFKKLKNRTNICDGPMIFLQQLLKIVPPPPYVASG
ncbi:b(0,+)-type amino acid transporter 1-like isoform X2 [Pomacea canaliculata]|uniref:b(0,+)-type amino acid transporter 1-like isoform X2 n=1 Tax=Pomacea canaliculata TaxID=400727 RepID=UPI000D72B796|nr:b(0,+)-type amino acid transporter 1-like isoform X2 [Pomacea canaliculata]